MEETLLFNLPRHFVLPRFACVSTDCVGVVESWFAADDPVAYLWRARGDPSVLRLPGAPRHVLGLGRSSVLGVDRQDQSAGTDLYALTSEGLLREVHACAGSLLALCSTPEGRLYWVEQGSSGTALWSSHSLDSFEPRLLAELSAALPRHPVALGVVRGPSADLVVLASALKRLQTTRCIAVDRADASVAEVSFVQETTNGPSDAMAWYGMEGGGLLVRSSSNLAAGEAFTRCVVASPAGEGVVLGPDQRVGEAGQVYDVQGARLGAGHPLLLVRARDLTYPKALSLVEISCRGGDVLVGAPASAGGVRQAWYSVGAQFVEDIADCGDSVLLVSGSRVTTVEEPRSVRSADRR